MAGKAVFLDRDGTLNEDPGYLSHPEGLVLFPGARDGLVRLKRAGFVLIIISNQSGVARGLIPLGSLPRIHQRLNEMLGPDAAVDDFELCTHHPDEDCACRKPKPKLLLDAALRLDLDLARSWIVGDRRSDLDSGRNAGLRGTVLVRTGHGADEEKELPPGLASHVAADITAAADWILRQG